MIGIRTRIKSDEVACLYELMRDREPSSAVMIDVGGHFGESLRNFALDGWNVHTFEPDASNRAVIEQKYGSLPNLRIEARGVSDVKQACAAFYRSSVSTGISSLSPFHETHIKAGTVELTTLSDYFVERGISRVDLLKVDTEGYDLFVLRGLPWQEIIPKIIICEFEDRKTRPLGYNHQTLGNFLIDKGYQVLLSEWHPVTTYGTSHRWRALNPYPAPVANTNAWGNFIAFRDPIMAERFASLLLCRPSQ